MKRALRIFSFELAGAFRRLSRAPGFTALVVGLLAPALAATLAVASAAYGLLFRPMPYPDDGQLVQVRAFMESIGFPLGLSVALSDDVPKIDGVESFGRWQVTRTVAGDPVAVQADAGLFHTLGVAPRLGRAYEDETDAKVAVISETLWRTRFAADAKVLGKVIEWRGEPHRIVAVMPAAFRFPDANTELWLPLNFTAADRAPENAGSFSGLGVLARLAPGATVAAFDERMRARFEADERVAPLLPMMKLRFEALSLRDVHGADTTAAMKQLGIAIAIVLLITGANLANLWLLRTVRRKRELAIAGALGASTQRAAAGVTVEILVATTIATALGIFMAPLASAALAKLGLVDLQGGLFVGIDRFAVVLALGVAVVTTCVLALVPWWVARSATRDGLQRATGLAGEKPQQARARRVLVALQIAAAMALLVGSGLLLRSLGELLRTDTGFRREGLVVATIGPSPAEKTDPDVLASRYAEVLALLREDPRFREVAAAITPPFSQSTWATTVRAPVAQPDKDLSSRTNWVTPNYFDTLGIALLAGPGFSTGAAREVVVDELFAERYLGGIDRAVGQSLQVTRGRDDPFAEATVVGVARTVKHTSLDEPLTEPTFYERRDQPDGRHSEINLLVRTDAPVEAVRAALAPKTTARGLPLAVASFGELIERTLVERRSLFALLAGFALFGVLLAMVGLYAVLAYSARLRIPELGLRRALGAGTGNLARRMFGEAARMLVPGLLLGTFAAFAVGRALSTQLYRIEAHDPATWLGVAALVLLLAGLAAAGPALRAARIEPTEALRHD